MNYLVYEWKLQAARQRRSPSKTFYGLGIVPFSDLFFTGVGLVKGGGGGVIKLALNGTQLLFTTLIASIVFDLLWVHTFIRNLFYRLFFPSVVGCATNGPALRLQLFNFLNVRMIRDWVLFRFLRDTDI